MDSSVRTQLEATIKQQQSALQARDMEISRLKTALYTVHAFGDNGTSNQNTTSNNNNSSKSWLTKKLTGNKSNAAKLATSPQSAYQAALFTNGRVLIDGLKRQVIEAERRAFDANTRLKSTQTELQAALVDNERLKAELNQLRNEFNHRRIEVNCNQRYDSSFTISSEGNNWFNH